MEPGEIKRMTDALQHRGPDGEGLWISNDNIAGLGHRRLSIIDLSSNASQPMHSADGRYTIVFNGEIYNYIELKEGLVKKGISFFSNSDTEVLLNLYALKQEKCLDDLDGMFAFAIWDNMEKRLFCARDPFGEKPFYYHYVPGKIFVFSSEMKALRSYGISMDFLPHRVAWYLNDVYALNNPSDQSETFYKDIKKLEAGNYIFVSKDIILTGKTYWDIDFKNVNYSISEAEAIDQFKFLLWNSVNVRLRSDVPIGTSLSGGMDSSAIVCIIEKLLNGNPQGQKTFSARFSNFDKDEGLFIEEVLKGKNIQGFNCWPSAEGLHRNFRSFLYHQEEPVGSANQFSQWEVMQLAGRENVTVLLDGQGADEIVTGYSHYYDVFFKELSLKHRERLDDELNSYINDFHPAYIPGFDLPVLKEKKESITGSLKKYAATIGRQIGVKAKYKGMLDSSFSEAAKKGGRFPYHNIDSSLNEALYYDAKKGKMETLLRYGDKNSMASSVEVRLPFLNKELVEFVFSLPPWLKIHNGWSKYVLRKAVAEILPSLIVERKDKIGYASPQQSWVENKEMNELFHWATAELKNAGILNKNSDAESLEKKKWQILNLGTISSLYK